MNAGPSTTLGKVARSVRNGLFARRPTDDPSGTPILRISAVRDGRVSLSDLRYVPELDRQDLEKFAISAGDLLITRYNGSRHLVGISGLVPDHNGPLIHPDKLIRVQLDEAVADSRFVNLQLASQQVRSFLEPRIRTTAGQSGIAGGDVREIPLWLPPMEDQRRIVEVLEHHLSRLDAATALLQAAQRRLKSMEASALSVARQGSEVALAEVAEIQGGIQKQPKRAPRDNCYPFLRVANVTARGLELDEVHQIELFGNELDRLRLEVGDLLVVEGNGSPSQIGRAATWDGSIANCVHQNHLIRVRPGRALLPEYLEAVWNSPETRRELTDLSSSSSGLHTLSVSKLSTLQLPVPSPDVQAGAVAAIREVRDSRQRVDLAIRSTSDRGASLRRALLAAAFSGRLS